MDFNSPFVIPVAGCGVAVVAIVAGIWSNAHSVRVRAEQRMAMLARGMSIPEIEKLLGKGEEEAPKDPLRSLSNARRAGIVCVSTGIGLISFFILLEIILGERAILSGAAAGLIPLAIGIGFFVDYNMQKRELSRFGLEVGAELPNNRRG